MPALSTRKRFLHSRRELRSLRVFFVLAFLLGGAALPCRAALSELETDDVRLIYFKGTQSYLVPHTVRCFTNSLQFEKKIFRYQPWDKITLVLTDIADYGNAGAGSAPYNGVSVQIAPPSFAYETYPANERMNTLMNHELVHIMAFDKTGKPDRFFRRLFRGKVYETDEHPESILYSYLTVPRRAAPRWYHEGLAVFVETWMAGGIGRAQGSFDEMVFRSMVRDGTEFHDPVSLLSEGARSDFQIDALSYMYGTRFLSHLAWESSPTRLMEWVAREDGTRAYYGSQFKNVFGKSLGDAWQEWVDWEHRFQQTNLDAIHAYPLTPYRDLAQRGLGSVSRAFVDEEQGRLYVGVNYPGTLAHIASLSLADGTMQKLEEIKDPALYFVTSLAWDPQGRRLFYTTDNNAHRDLVELDPATGKSRRLMKDFRVGELVYSAADRGLWGIRHLNGISTLVRIPDPFTEWSQVFSWPYGQVPYDLDISPDAKQVSVSVGHIDGSHFLLVLPMEGLLKGDLTPVAQMDFGSTIPSNFVFSKDGRYLYGSSYYTGVSNIFRFEPATGELEAMSNTDGGMFRPIPMEGDRLLAFRFTGAGFLPVEIEARPVQDVSAITFLGERIADKYTEVRDWNAGSPAGATYTTMSEGDYRPFRSLRLESFYQVVEGYKDFAAYGFVSRFSDPVQINKIMMTASWSPEGSVPDAERLHGSIEYERLGWTGYYRYNDADFYDLFGPTKVSRKGYVAGGSWKKTLFSDAPKNLDLEVRASYHNNMDRLPRYQNVEATFDNLISGGLSLTYQNLRNSIGAVDAEKGFKLAGHVVGNHVEGESIPIVVGTADAGFPVGLPNSSIWMRTAAGRAFGDPDDPFANFYFGGFGNNRVDHGEIKRYRVFDSFPGFELNEIQGQSFIRTLLEWNLPPIRFHHMGSPGLHLTWIRTSIFTGGLRTNLEENDLDRTAGHYGAQMDFRFTALSRLRMTFSLGYAVGFEKDGERSDEFMFSLKVL